MGAVKVISVLWAKEGDKKNNNYWSTKYYLLLMFLGYGTQQHCFALLFAYSTEFWKLAMIHLNFSICPAKQLFSYQHLSLKAFVYLLQNIKQVNFFSLHFNVHNLFITENESCLAYGFLQLYLHKLYQKQQCQEVNLHQAYWHHELKHRLFPQQPLIQELLHLDHYL